MNGRCLATQLTGMGREYSVTSGRSLETEIQGPLFGTKFEFLKAHNRPLRSVRPSANWIRYKMFSSR